MSDDRPGEQRASPSASCPTPVPRRLTLLADRVRPLGAYGVSLIGGLVLLAAAAIAFAHLTEDVLHRTGLTWVDGPVNTAVPGLRTPALTAVMKALTLLGSTPAVVAVVVLGGLLMRARTGTWRPAILLGIVAGGAAVLDVAVKTAVHRPRPPAGNAIAHAAGYAFPSGHTTVAAVYAGLAYLLAATVPAVWARVCVWVGALLLGAGIGLSRVYLGVHWLTDVLGGWALGVAWLAFALTVAATIGHLRPDAALLTQPATAGPEPEPDADEPTSTERSEPPASRQGPEGGRRGMTPGGQAQPRERP